MKIVVTMNGTEVHTEEFEIKIDSHFSFQEQVAMRQEAIKFYLDLHQFKFDMIKKMCPDCKRFVVLESSMDEKKNEDKLLQAAFDRTLKKLEENVDVFKRLKDK